MRIISSQALLKTNEGRYSEIRRAARSWAALSETLEPRGAGTSLAQTLFWWEEGETTSERPDILHSYMLRLITRSMSLRHRWLLLLPPLVALLLGSWSAYDTAVPTQETDDARLLLPCANYVVSLFSYCWSYSTVDSYSVCVCFVV